MTTLFNLTYFSFLVCGIAGLGAVVYFFTQIPQLTGRLKLLAFLNVGICAVSSILHFYFFTQLQSFTAGAAGVAEMTAAISALPLALRYTYWLVTTMVLISMFPLLMGLERVGIPFLRILLLTDAAMILTGYLGEHSTLTHMGEGLPFLGLFWFTISGLLFSYLTFSIFQVLRRLSVDDMGTTQRDALAYMFFFFLIGWMIFPAGFFYALVFDPDVGVILRELTVNIGDIVNKVIWGMLVVYTAVEIQSYQE
ncbi:hypothetical protein CKO09_02395 [Chromatium weissei]|nr:hypothetical protein [Chromatium weissei]